jgi:hypothetical protein
MYSVWSQLTYWDAARMAADAIARTYAPFLVAQVALGAAALLGHRLAKGR